MLTRITDEIIHTFFGVPSETIMIIPLGNCNNQNVVCEPLVTCFLLNRKTIEMSE